MVAYTMMWEITGSLFSSFYLLRWNQLCITLRYDIIQSDERLTPPKLSLELLRHCLATCHLP